MTSRNHKAPCSTTDVELTGARTDTGALIALFLFRLSGGFGSCDEADCDNTDLTLQVF